MPDCNCLSSTYQYIEFAVIVLLALAVIYHVYQVRSTQRILDDSAASAFTVLKKISPFTVKAMRERATNRGKSRTPVLGAESDFVRGGLSSGADLRFLSAGQGTGSAENFLNGPGVAPEIYDVIDRPPVQTTVVVGGKTYTVNAMDAMPAGGVVLNELNSAAFAQEGMTSRSLNKSRGFDAVFDNSLNGF